jgi:hypothetical protein
VSDIALSVVRNFNEGKKGDNEEKDIKFLTKWVALPFRGRGQREEIKYYCNIYY